MRKLILTLIGISALAAATTLAQAQCRPAAESNEAKLLAFYSVPLTFSMDQGAAKLPAGAIRVGFEGGPVPNPAASLRHTGACFQSKSENSDLAPAFGRPRIAVGLPFGFAAEASYLPPITIADAEPNLGALSLLYASAPIKKEKFAFNLITRAHTTIGYIKGPITCPKEALQQTDVSDACYGSNPSEDTYRPNTFGLEAALNVRRYDSRISGYLGTGWNAVHPRFQVGFTDGTGYADNTKVEVNLSRVAVFAGGSINFTKQFDVGLQVYSVPQDVTTFKLGVGYRLK